MKARAVIKHVTVIPGILFAVVTAAAPPQNTPLDPKLHAWFESLKRPGMQQPCCSVSDCRFTEYRIRDGHYEVVIDGSPYSVPDRSILYTTDNPTGKAVVCTHYVDFGDSVPPQVTHAMPEDTVKIFCFIPPKSTS